jgi:DNA-binding NarL/FixJ family response regulator
MTSLPDLEADGERVGPTRVVLVDDHAQLRDLYRRFLEDCDDIEVVATCACARDGIAATESNRPDVVLIDLSLPDMNGIDAIRELRRAVPTAHVIVVSGADATVASIEAAAAGAVAYIDKIDVPHDLVPTIREVAGEA